MDQITDVRPLGAPRRLRLYAPARNRNFACTYYRMEVPFRTAEDLGQADFKIDDLTTLNNWAREKWAVSSDIHLFWFMASEAVLAHFRAAAKMSPYFDKKSKQWIRPARCVFDADDDVEYIDQFNPRFASMGTIAPDDKTRLKTGDRIAIEMPDGKEMVMWEDGKHSDTGDLFDIAENRERIKEMGKVTRAAAGVTVTTEPLAAAFRSRYGCKNVYVFPNSVRFDDYPKVNIRRNPRTVTILYQGGWSHWRDIEPLPGVLGRVSRKYPEVRFIFWGQRFSWMAQEIAPTRREHMRWMPYDAYKLRLATLDVDINLAPLANRMFNLSKSAIKFYEPAALSHPVPTIAANIGPYREIIDGETGMTYDSLEELETKLCTLIENRKLRRQLAANAKDWVKDHRDAFVTVPPLLDWYRSLQDE